MIKFLLGFILGAMFGFVLTALMVAVRRETEEGGPQWIPIGFKVPPASHVLVTLQHSKDDLEVIELDYWAQKKYETATGKETMIQKVIAWMPMPKPYKEED